MQYVAESDAQVMDSLIASLNKRDEIIKEKIDFVKFNPNNVTQEEMIALGFSERTARQIVNYRSKGGLFRTKKDLYRIYSIDTTHVDELYEFIDLPETTRVTNERNPGHSIDEATEIAAVPKTSKKEVDIAPAFDINQADTSVLKTINGIGSVLSKRIITFRNKLGGFVDNAQLYEVYSLDSAVVEKLLEVAYIADGFEARLIHINTINQEALADHPYVSRKKARLIVAYRNQHGRFSSEEDLLKVYSITESDLDRITPYIQWATPD